MYMYTYNMYMYMEINYMYMEINYMYMYIPQDAVQSCPLASHIGYVLYGYSYSVMYSSQTLVWVLGLIPIFQY